MHFFVRYIFVLLPFGLFAQSDTLALPQTFDSPPASATSLSLCDSMVCHAQTLLGVNYRYQGKSPKTGFDCSGFVCYNFKRYNIKLPHSSYEQAKLGEKVKRNEAQAGDLIFFKGSSLKSKKAGHVGIITAKNSSTIYFIHAALKGGIRVDSTDSDYYKKRFLDIRRIPIIQSSN